MKWYWWVVIVAALTVLGYLKLKIWNKIKESKKKKQDLEDE